MHDFTPIPALLGGALIGLSASLLLLTHGKVAGISGIYAGALRSDTPDRGMRIAFLVGLVAAGVALRIIASSLRRSSRPPGRPRFRSPSQAGSWSASERASVAAAPADTASAG
jgi:uncharacterized membrane protein YedE/YeeE